MVGWCCCWCCWCLLLKDAYHKWCFWRFSQKGNPVKSRLLAVGFILDGLFVVLLGDHDALEVLRVDHASVDLELAEGVVDLVARELLAPGHQRMAEPEIKTNKKL